MLEVIDIPSGEDPFQLAIIQVRLSLVMAWSTSNALEHNPECSRVLLFPGVPAESVGPALGREVRGEDMLEVRGYA